MNALANASTRHAHLGSALAPTPLHRCAARRAGRRCLVVLAVALFPVLIVPCAAADGLRGSPPSFVLAQSSEERASAVAVDGDHVVFAVADRVALSFDRGATLRWTTLGRVGGASRRARAFPSGVLDESQASERPSRGPGWRSRSWTSGAGGFSARPRRRAGGPAVRRGRRKRAGRRVRHVTVSSRILCAARARALFCGAPTGERLRRVRLPGRARVFALASANERFAVATSAGLFVGSLEGALERRIDRRVFGVARALDGVAWLVATATRLLACEDSRALVEGEGGGCRVLARGPLVRGLGRAVTLAQHAGDQYVDTAMSLLRREGAGFVRIPRPSPGSFAMAVCGARLGVGGARGFQLLSVDGWQRAHASDVRGVACAGGRFVLAGEGGLWFETTSPDEARSRRARPRLVLAKRFASRAWWSRALPELVAQARFVRGADHRGPLDEGVWSGFALPGHPARDPSLRLAWMERFELTVWLRWPFGNGAVDDAVHAARREDRRLVRRALRRRRRRERTRAAVWSRAAVAYPGQAPNRSCGVRCLAMRTLARSEAAARGDARRKASAFEVAR